MDARDLGLLIAILGAVLVAVGLLVSTGVFGWLGRLPGDIRIGSDGVRVYIPIVSMLLLSVALTVIVNLIRRLF